MNSREFFFLVKNLRRAQTLYFQERTQSHLRACKVLEREVDEEIYRVVRILEEREGTQHG